jgi:hypothetical protein
MARLLPIRQIAEELRRCFIVVEAEIRAALAGLRESGFQRWIIIAG